MSNMIEQAFAPPEEGDCGSWSQSADTTELYASLVAFQGEAPNVIKRKKADLGKGGQWLYAPLSVVRSTLQPILAKHGLGVIQLPHQGYRDGYFCVGVTTRVIHKSGQWLQSPPFWCCSLDHQGGPSARPISFGSAFTYARRYSYEACLGIVASRDDDGVMASGYEEKSATPPRDRTGSHGELAAVDAGFCPDCGKALRMRSGKRGDFFGCTGYPDCKYTRDMILPAASGAPAEVVPSPAQTTPSDPLKAAREREWQKLKTMAIAAGMTDMEVSLWVTGLGMKKTGVAVEDIVALQHLVPDVADDLREWKHVHDDTGVVPGGKHFLQLSAIERKKALQVEVPF